jgi:hypothetical protein
MSFITCEFAGRLGNQLFQAATTIGVAKWHKMDYYFPENPFGLPVLPTDKGILNIWFEKENQMYQDIPALPNLLLKGYFQKELYFSPFWPEIRKIFQDYFIRVTGKPIKIEEKTCSIHVRFGDYLIYPDYFAQLNRINYYDKAISRLLENTKFKVFSDDIEMAKNMFGNMANFEFMEGGTPEQDLWDMAMCETHIIANSSFSYWAAKIIPDKTIFAPANWFTGKNAHLYTNGLRDGMTII